jgi:hypothetical protein
VETRAHSRLKRLAAVFLRAEGFMAVAFEVRCPGSNFRVDAAGWLDRLPWPKDDAGGDASLWSTVDERARARTASERRCEPRTIIIECKQSRSDFIRDDRQADELLALRDEAERWARHVEEHRIKPNEPELRRSGVALFPDLEDWDFTSSRLQSYRRLLRRIAALERQLYGETKFFRMARYRLADQLFLAAPRGLIRPREVPRGWGLLEAPREAIRSMASGECAAFTVAVPAPRERSKPEFRSRLLRNIAIAATRDSLGSGAKSLEPPRADVEVKSMPYQTPASVAVGQQGETAESRPDTIGRARGPNHAVRRSLTE